MKVTAAVNAVSNPVGRLYVVPEDTEECSRCAHIVSILAAHKATSPAWLVAEVGAETLNIPWDFA
jgi:hypothetical protein